MMRSSELLEQLKILDRASVEKYFPFEISAVSLLSWKTLGVLLKQEIKQKT